jgi:sec-independent protein translocase protein TatA
MGTFSIWHWLIVLVVVLVLFGGRGKISGLMGDVGKGIKSFRSGLKEGEAAKAEEGAAEPAKVEEKDKAPSA